MHYGVRFFSCFVLIALSWTTTICSAAPEPSVTFQSMLSNIYFDDESGVISIRDIDLAFAPQGEIKASVALVDSTNTVLASHGFYPDPRWREGVFARLTQVGPADFQVTEPGVYNIVFLVDGKPVSRLPVALEQTSTGDDPFNPDKTFRFYGLWQAYAFLRLGTLRDEPFPELNFWVGGRDLAEGDSKDQYRVIVKRGEDIIAHSRRTQGFIADGHYEPTRILLYHPHEKKDTPNAEAFMLSDWTSLDGLLTVEVIRSSDDSIIRRFKVTIADGKVVNLSSTEIGFEPQMDYIVPRIHNRGGNRYEFEEAFWIKSE